MWTLKYLYGRFRLFLIIEVFLNTSFATIFVPWVASRGIKDFDASLILFFFASGMGLILYGYQMWQAGIFAQPREAGVSRELQPAAAKPLPKDQQDDSNKISLIKQIIRSAKKQERLFESGLFKGPLYFIIR
jgi:hypothetical protein